MYPQIRIHLSLLSLGIFGLAILALFLGVYQFNESILSIINKAITNRTAINDSDYYVLFDLRLPRIIMSILVGSGLAVAGTCLQGIFKNPLASPDLIGITSGKYFICCNYNCFGRIYQRFCSRNYSLLIA